MQYLRHTYTGKRICCPLATLLKFHALLLLLGTSTSGNTVSDSLLLNNGTAPAIYTAGMLSSPASHIPKAVQEPAS